MNSGAVLENASQAYNSGMLKPIFQVFSNNPKLPISSIEYDGVKLEFKKPYMLTVKVEGDYIEHEDKKLNMIVSGKTLDELVEAFFGDFVFIWREYALCDDSKLSGGAVKLKQHILSLAREI